MDTKKIEVLDALRQYHGIVKDAVRLAKVARSTFYVWYDEDAEFKQAVDDIREDATDFVEGRLFGKIEEGDTTAIIFYLKTRGKKRGYVERQEVEHSGTGVNLNIIMPDGV